jgi:hypothetical protein
VRSIEAMGAFEILSRHQIYAYTQIINWFSELANADRNLSKLKDSSESLIHAFEIVLTQCPSQS